MLEGGETQWPRGRGRTERFVISSVTLSGLGLLDAAAAFLADAVIVSKFGLQAGTDAFFAAHTIPALLISFVNTSSVALVPVFARQQARHGEEAAWRLFNVILSWALAVACFGALVGFGLAPLLTRLIVPGFDEETSRLTVQLSRILLLVMPLSFFIQVAQSFLIAHRWFALPLSLGTLQNLVKLGVIVAFSAQWGIFALAWGEAIGEVVQMLGTAFLLYCCCGLHYRPSFDLRHHGVEELRQVVFAPASSVAAARLTVVVERIIASFLPTGSLTALRYGYRITQALGRILLAGIAQVITPALSASMAMEDTVKTRREIKRAIKLAALLVIPILIGIWMLKVPMVQVLFQRGAFNEQASLATASALGYYALSLFFSAHNRVITRFFYASLRGGLLVLLSAVTGLATILWDLGLVSFMGASGLALGYSLGTGTGAVLGILVMLRRMREFEWMELLTFELKVAGAAAVMAAAIPVIRPWAGQLFASWGPGSYTLRLLLTIVGGALVFGLAAFLLRIRELRDFVISLSRRRRRSSLRERPEP